VLEHTGGNRTRAAQILGISRRTLHRMAERRRKSGDVGDNVSHHRPDWRTRLEGPHRAWVPPPPLFTLRRCDPLDGRSAHISDAGRSASRAPLPYACIDLGRARAHLW